MVEYEQDMAGQSSVDPCDLVARGVGAGRVVGIGDVDDPRLVGDAGEHRVDIGRIILVGGDHRGRAHAPRRDLIDRETVMRSEEHTSELQSLMRISYAVFCLKKKTISNATTNDRQRD